MNTFFCPHCGGEIPQGMQFCPHCMTALGEAERLETRPTGKNKKPAVIAMALVLCAVVGLGIFIALRDNAGNKSDDTSKNNSTHTYESADENFNESVLTESLETQSSVAESIDDTSSITDIFDSSENSIAESSAAETESITDTAISGLTKENLAADITSYCADHKTEFFGLDNETDISFEEQDGDISIEFTDSFGAMIFIETDKNADHCELYFRAGHQDSEAHCGEILAAMGEILFGCDLSGKEGSFTEGGYRFGVEKSYMKELFYCEYYVAADRLS